MNSQRKVEPIGFKSRKEIAAEYKIDRKTLYRWITENNLPISTGLLSEEEQKIIYEKFGYPKKRK